MHATSSETDVSSRNSFNSLFPMRVPGKMPGVERTPAQQKMAYSHALETKAPPSFFKNRCWIPIPAGDAQYQWSKQKIQEHLAGGFPLYWRLNHAEDRIYTYNCKTAILPSRINVNARSEYDPKLVQDTFYTYRNSILPRHIRFSESTVEAIEAIREKEKGNRWQATVRYAQTPDPLPTERQAERIVGDLLQLHSSACTRRTPFKGMIGGTLADSNFIKEMKQIISGYPADSELVVIIDRYGRFIHNWTNTHQRREFVAIGGILESEIVAKLKAADFLSLFATSTH